MSEKFDLIVIGGGHNGLVTAAYAAKQRRKVLVVEARSSLGGLAASEEFYAGYKSPGVLHDSQGLRPWIIKDLGLANHGLKLRTDEVPTFFPDRGEGRGMLLWRDADRAREEIAPYSEQDAKMYGEYRRYIKKLTPFVQKVFDDFPPELTSTSFGGYIDLMKKAASLRFLGRDDMMEILRIAPMCVADWLNEFFETDLLKAGLSGPAIYNSWCGPWSPGTNANLLMHECLSWSPVVGGPAAVAASLVKACESAGVTMRTGAEVTQLAFSGDKVTGVKLADGSEISADRVAASCDPKSLFLKLVPAELLSHGFEHNIANVRSRGTAAKINLALSDYPEWKCRPGLKPDYIRLGTSLDGLERAFDAVKYRQMSERPALDIYVPTIDDPSLAPNGGHVFSILTSFVPEPLEGGWNDAAKDELLNRTLTVLGDYAPDIRKMVVGSQVTTPADLANDYHLSGGHLFHAEHAADQLLIRPFPECAHYSSPFEGLFLCGSGGHPGGGITGAPGAFAAKALLGS